MLAAPIISFSVYAVVGTVLYRGVGIRSPATVVLAVALVAGLSAWARSRERRTEAAEQDPRSPPMPPSTIGILVLALALVVVPAISASRSANRHQGFAAFVVQPSGKLGAPRYLAPPGTVIPLNLRIANYAASQRSMLVRVVTPWKSTMRRVTVAPDSDLLLEMPTRVPIDTRGRIAITIRVSCTDETEHCNPKVLDLHLDAGRP